MHLPLLFEQLFRSDLIPGFDVFSGIGVQEVRRAQQASVAGILDGVIAGKRQRLVQGQAELLAKQPNVDVGNASKLAKLGETILSR
jgi:hypothetical protein